MNTDKPVFLYFNGSGRVIPARIALFAAFGKDGWIDEKIDLVTFKEEKIKYFEGADDAKLVSGSLPQITLPSGKTYCETLSIARWACTCEIQNGVDIEDLYPTKNTDNYMIMEESMTIAMEILDKCPRDPNAEVLKKKREEYASEKGFLSLGMKVLERRLCESEGNFLLGNEPCLADFTIYTLINMISIGMFDHVPKDYVEKFPKILKHLELIRTSSWIKKYVEAYGKEP